MEGPAHLDLTNGVAHKLPDCPRLLADDPMCMGEAAGGEMSGFEPCPDCWAAQFVEQEPEHE
jgi:hypothetical protein